MDARTEMVAKQPASAVYL